MRGSTDERLDRRPANIPLAWEFLALVAAGLNAAVVGVCGYRVGLAMPASGEVRPSAHRYSTVWAASPVYKLCLVVAFGCSVYAAVLVWYSYLHAQTVVVAADQRCVGRSASMEWFGSPYRVARKVRVLLAIAVAVLPLLWLAIGALPVVGLPPPPCLRGKVVVCRGLLVIGLIGGVTLLLACQPIECEASGSRWTFGSGRPGPPGGGVRSPSARKQQIAADRYDPPAGVRGVRVLAQRPPE